MNFFVSFTYLYLLLYLYFRIFLIDNNISSHMLKIWIMYWTEWPLKLKLNGIVFYNKVCIKCRLYIHSVRRRVICCSRLGSETVFITLKVRILIWSGHILKHQKVASGQQLALSWTAASLTARCPGQRSAWFSAVPYTVLSLTLCERKQNICSKMKRYTVS